MSGTSADLQQRAVRGPVGGEGGEGHRVQADGGAPQQEHDVLRAGGPVLRKEAHHPAHPATQRGEGGGAKTARQPIPPLGFLRLVGLDASQEQRFRGRCFHRVG